MKIKFIEVKIFKKVVDNLYMSWKVKTFSISANIENSKLSSYELPLDAIET